MAPMLIIRGVTRPFARFQISLEAKGTIGSAISLVVMAQQVSRLRFGEAESRGGRAGYVVLACRC